MTLREPGVYLDIPNAEYHGETEWFSSTQLKGYVPELYKPPTGRDALDFGTALHARVLGTDERIDVHDFPTWRSKAAEQARAESDADKAVPILAEDDAHIEAMIVALRDHEQAARLLWERPGRNEVSVFAQDNEGLRHKCRPDRFLDNGLIVDLKSTSAKPGNRGLAAAAVDYGYDLSAAHYIETCELAGLDPSGFALVFVSKTAPYRVSVAQFGDLLEDGYALRDLAIRRATNAADPYQGASGFLTLNRPYRRDIPA